MINTLGTIVIKYLCVGAVIVYFISCQSNKNHAPTAIPSDWLSITEKARGQSISMMMWQGDPMINAYMEGYVKTVLADSFNIQLNIISGQGNDIVSFLRAELEANISEGQIDICWINGETFYQLRQMDILHGPFVENLPNARNIDFSKPYINEDFQQPVNGYECPWGTVQMAFIYNSSYIKNPPQTPEELKRFILNHPNRFTISSDFTGMTFLKSLMIALSETPQSFKGPFNESVYIENSAKLWSFIKEVQPAFWNKGKSFPNSITQMHQLFSSGELWFTMSNNENEVFNKVQQGVFPLTSRGYFPSFKTIRNAHFLGIPKLSKNKEAA